MAASGEFSMAIDKIEQHQQQQLLRCPPRPKGSWPNQNAKASIKPRAIQSRLKGDEGRQIWSGWTVLAYHADTLAIRAR
jgi:hypothetical protein